MSLELHCERRIMEYQTRLNTHEKSQRVTENPSTDLLYQSIIKINDLKRKNDYGTDLFRGIEATPKIS